MTQERFEKLVARLESSARRHPALYRLRVLLLALLGYGYLTAILSLLLVLLLAALASVVFLKALAIKLAIPIAVFVWLVIKAMWVRLPPPDGRPVTRREAPELFAMIDRLRKRLRAPRFHRVLITDEFNAAVAQTPRLGVFGWYRNYLMLGLPLMKTLTPDQFEAVVAHELGHLAGGHGRLSSWLYRLRSSWARLMDALDAQKRFGTFLFRPFFHWYAPFFNAYSFPLARANEYEADGASARLTSPRAAAEALTAVNVVGSYLDERFWPGIHRRADETPHPAFGPYSHLGERLTDELPEADVRGWLSSAMARETTVADTHPSLADRLKALGEQPRLAPPAAGASADTLLGPVRTQILSEFDSRWQESIKPAWENRYREVQEGRQRLADLDAAAGSGRSLTVDEARERAELTEAFGAGPDAALPQFRELHARAPEDPAVCFALGQRLLARGEAEGAALVETVMALDERAIIPACEALRDFHWATGNEAEAHAWHDKLLERAGLLQAAEAEREALHLSDKLDPHGLGDDALEDLRRQLRAVAGARKVYLVRKRVQHLPEHPLWVLGFRVTPWWGIHRKRRSADVQQRILEQVQMPGETLVINVEGANYRFGRKLRFRRGARIL